MTTNQVVRRIGALVLLYADQEAPSSTEWDDFLAVLALPRAELSKIKVLILTNGGSPTAPQRKRLEDALGGIRFRTAVVSDSIKVRFVASAIALFHRDHRSFAMSEIQEAYDHLQMTAAERILAQTTIREMKTLVR